MQIHWEPSDQCDFPACKRDYLAISGVQVLLCQLSVAFPSIWNLKEEDSENLLFQRISLLNPISTQRRPSAVQFLHLRNRLPSSCERAVGSVPRVTCPQNQARQSNRGYSFVEEGWFSLLVLPEIRGMLAMHSDVHPSTDISPTLLHCFQHTADLDANCSSIYTI